MEKDYWALVSRYGEYSLEVLRYCHPHGGPNRRKNVKMVNGPKVVTELRALGYRATFHVLPDQPLWGRVTTDAPRAQLDLACVRAKAPGRYLTKTEASVARSAVYAASALAASVLQTKVAYALNTVTPCHRCGGFGGAVEEAEYGVCHQRDPLDVYHFVE